MPVRMGTCSEARGGQEDSEERVWVKVDKYDQNVMIGIILSYLRAIFAAMYKYYLTQTQLAAPPGQLAHSPKSSMHPLCGCKCRTNKNSFADSGISLHKS